MTSPAVDANRARDIFSKAIEHHPAGQWQAFLDSARDGNEPLRQRERLLDAELSNFTAQPAAGEAHNPHWCGDAAPGTGVRPRLASSATEHTTVLQIDENPEDIANPRRNPGANGALTGRTRIRGAVNDRRQARHPFNLASGVASRESEPGETALLREADQRRDRCRDGNLRHNRRPDWAWIRGR